MSDDHPAAEQEQPPGAEDPLSCVFIFNMSEDVWPFIEAMDRADLQHNEIAENAALTDPRYIGFYAEHPEGGVYLSPVAVGSNYQQYLEALFGRQNIRIVVTPTHTGRICADVVNDPAIMASLARLKEIDLTSYCPSPELFNLAENLTSRGVMVRLPETPSRQAWETVSGYATKSGIRQLVTGESATQGCLHMADGAVYDDFEMAVQAAARRALQGGVVLKTNKGHSGMGVAIFPPDHIVSDIEWARVIRQKLKADNGYWEKFPIVVEDFIKIDPQIAGGLPNVECRVKQNGEVEVLYYCGMRVVAGGVFAGVEIHNWIAPPEYIAQLEVIGKTLGKAYAQAGYRGYFDVDCLVGQDGVLYVGESNIRRTGGTYVYHVAKRLLGDDFTQHYYIASRMYDLPHVWTFGDLHDRLQPYLYNPQTKEGVVMVSSDNLLRLKKFGYLVIGKDREREWDIEQKMLALVSL